MNTCSVNTFYTPDEIAAGMAAEEMYLTALLAAIETVKALTGPDVTVRLSNQYGGFVEY